VEGAALHPSQRLGFVEGCALHLTFNAFDCTTRPTTV